MQFTQYLDLTPTGDFEIIAVTNADVSQLSALMIPNAKGVFITVETNNIRYRIDGDNPTTVLGHIVYAGGNIYFRDPASIRNLRIISTVAGGSTLMVTYYK